MIECCVGKRFGRLTVVEEPTCGNGDGLIVKCVCDCGTEKYFRLKRLRSGRTKSCGCYRIEKITKHGLSGTHTYSIWTGMMARCYQKGHQAYKNYGGRGIHVCQEWHTFENFLEHFGMIPAKLEIDRIDNNVGYSVENCRLATRVENSRNRRNNRILAYKGENKTVAEWSLITGIRHDTILYRINTGYSTQEALETPVRTHIRKNKRDETVKVVGI